MMKDLSREKPRLKSTEFQKADWEFQFSIQIERKRNSHQNDQGLYSFRFLFVT